MEDVVAPAGQAIGVEPHLSLAFAMQSAPGAYALLLGAGVSVSARVPSAWEVQAELIRRLARAGGDDPDDPFAWYRRRFGKDSRYSELLNDLVHTQVERQDLLRGFFEPSDQEREQGLKQPTPAHRAIARLVARGLIKVILTINFDRLMETALRDVGIEPTVVTSPADIHGLKPLHAQDCLVVHLHGDFLSPMGMLNTAEELGAYPREVNELLDKLFSEYGLVIVGWSATWDSALRDAISRNSNRYYATHWVDPFPLGKIAEDLRVRRESSYIQADADTFFGRLVDACEAIADTGRRHPLTVAIAVATAKRALAGRQTAIPLHDTIRQEMESLRALDVLNATDFRPSEIKDAHAQRLGKIETALEVPLGLIATTAYWGNTATDAWWFDDIARFAERPMVNGSTKLISLLQLPATAILYAAGIAAVAARRHDLLVRLLTEPTSINSQDERVPIAGQLPPDAVWGLPRSHRRLHLLLRPIFEGHLWLGEAAYRDASERFEYLRLIQTTFEALKRNSLHDRGSSLTEMIARLEKKRNEDYFRESNEYARISRGQKVIVPLQGEELRKAKARDAKRVAEARDDLAQLPEQLSRYARIGTPHIRALEPRRGYTCAPAQAIGAEIERQGARHPLVELGLCGGKVDQLRWSMLAVDNAFKAFASEAAWSTPPPSGGVLPSAPFYPDEIGKWAE